MFFSLATFHELRTTECTQNLVTTFFKVLLGDLQTSLDKGKFGVYFPSLWQGLKTLEVEILPPLQ